MSDPRSTAAANFPPHPGTDRHRLDLLGETDRMLAQVELLRLDDETVIPPLLALRMRRLLAALGRPEPARLREIRVFHNLVFALQQRLMAANPRRAATRTYAGRAQGTPVLLAVGGEGRWKHLVLPAPDDIDQPAGFEAWIGLVDATVERALDRWNYAITHAVRCARDTTRRHQAPLAAATAMVAWNNYWDLAEEAVAVRRRAPRAMPEAA